MTTAYSIQDYALLSDEECAVKIQAAKTIQRLPSIVLAA